MRGGWRTSSGSSSATASTFHIPGSGQYLAPMGIGSSSSGAGLPAYQVEVGIPIFIPVAATFDRVGVYVDTAVASSEVRLGIRNVSTLTGGPGSLVLDAGTVLSTSTGEKLITISQALSVGWYWLTATRQIADGAAIRAASFFTNPFGLIPASVTQATAPDKQTWKVSGVTGALAATPTFTVDNSGSQGPPIIVLRRA